MAFENTFTGKGTGLVFPTGERLDKAQENMSSMILKAEEIKQAAFQKNEQEFLKNANIDPVFVLSSASRDAQAKMLDEYNSKWGKVMKARGGNLSTDDKMQMAKEKDYILMQQQNMQADYQRAMLDREAVSKDVQGNIDHDDFQQRWNDYIKSGTYDKSPLLPSELNPIEFYNKAVNKVNGTPSNVTTTKTIGGIPYKETYQSSGSEQEGRDKVKVDMLNNDRLARAYISEFQKLKDTDPETYRKYLDTNNDGTVSAQEAQAAQSASNPILQWAQDTYWHKALDMKLSTPTKNTVGAGSRFNLNIFGRNVKFNPGAQRQGDILYADQSFHNPFEFDGTFKLANIPTEGGSILKGQYTKPISSKGNVEGYLKNYDADKDVFILAATGTDPNIDNGVLIEIPAKNFNQTEINKIPVVVNGKQTTIGAIRGNRPTPSTTKKTGELDNL